MPNNKTKRKAEEPETLAQVREWEANKRKVKGGSGRWHWLLMTALYRDGVVTYPRRSTWMKPRRSSCWIVMTGSVRHSPAAPTVCTQISDVGTGGRLIAGSGFAGWLEVPTIAKVLATPTRTPPSHAQGIAIRGASRGLMSRV